MANGERNRLSSRRWNPTEQQKEILHDLYFNQGVRYPRRGRLQEVIHMLRPLGSVEEKNVTHWFKNRNYRIESSRPYRSRLHNEPKYERGDAAAESRELQSLVSDDDTSFNPPALQVAEANVPTIYTNYDQTPITFAAYQLQRTARGTGSSEIGESHAMNPNEDMPPVLKKASSDINMRRMHEKITVMAEEEAKEGNREEETMQREMVCMEMFPLRPSRGGRDPDNWLTKQMGRLPLRR